ncbi:MAG: hypothetical protein GKR95_17635 [Gammaproteobacteria bacterium]|nr:hypothetical protein [Gammaproteobacteria bacterium]
MQLSLPNTCCHKRNTTLSVVVLALWFSLALAIFVSPATLAAAPGTACNTTTTSSLLGTIGQSGECNGLLIVDRQMLDTAINRAMASPQQNYYIVVPEEPEKATYPV